MEAGLLPEGPSPAQDAMMAQAKDVSDFLKTLANENRLLLLCLLAEGEKTVTELEAILQLRQPTVSQQLARLRSEGLVATRRDGKTVHYSLASEEVRRVMALLYELFCGSAEASR